MSYLNFKSMYMLQSPDSSYVEVAQQYDLACAGSLNRCNDITKLVWKE